MNPRTNPARETPAHPNSALENPAQREPVHTNSALENPAHPNPARQTPAQAAPFPSLAPPLLLLQAWLGLALASLVARTVPFATWSGWAGRPLGSSPFRRRPAPQAQLRQAVDQAARLAFWPCACLARSLALSWLLRRHGHPHRLVLGARLRQGQFQAHAWIGTSGADREPVDHTPVFTIEVQ